MTIEPPRGGLPRPPREEGAPKGAAAWEGRRATGDEVDKVGLGAARLPVRGGSAMRQVMFFLFACGLILAAEVGARSASGEEDLTVGGRLRVSVEAVNSPLLVGEPLYLRLSWRNTSEQAVQLVYRGVYQVHVSVEGQPPALLHLCREWGPSNIRRVSPINLDPGQVYMTNVWVDLVGEHEGRLLFDRAGTYRIRPAGFPPDSAALVEVRDPVDPQDRQASRLWTQAAARAWASARDLVGDTLTEAVRSSVDEILAKCPESRFASYAAWIKVMDLKHRIRWWASSDVNYPAVLKWLEFILTRHPKSPLREAVLEKAVDAYLAQGDWSRARETAEQLAREFPLNTRVARLRKIHGEDFERLALLPPPWKLAIVAKLGFRSGFVAWPGLLAVVLAFVVCTAVGWPALLHACEAVGPWRIAAMGAAMLLADVGVGLLVFGPNSFLHRMQPWGTRDYMVIMAVNLAMSFAVTGALIWLLARRGFQDGSPRLRRVCGVAALLLANYFLTFAVYVICRPH